MTLAAILGGVGHGREWLKAGMGLFLVHLCAVTVMTGNTADLSMGGVHEIL